MSGPYIVILFFYLYGGARPRGGPATPPRASIQAMARILIEGEGAVGNLKRHAPPRLLVQLRTAQGHGRVSSAAGGLAERGGYTL
jgi:hypothetical protein